MCEKSAAGGSRKAAIADVIGLFAPVAPGRAPPPGAPAVAVVSAPTPGAAAPGLPGPEFVTRPGRPPGRPPERLSQPSPLSLKKSVTTILFEGMPPRELPPRQRTLLFSL